MLSKVSLCSIRRIQRYDRTLFQVSRDQRKPGGGVAVTGGSQFEKGGVELSRDEGSNGMSHGYVGVENGRMSCKRSCDWDMSNVEISPITCAGCR